jgi:hypothetical protein
MSGRQLEREIGLSHKAAWFMAHRIRAAMAEEPVKSTVVKLGGFVECHETCVGGKPRKSLRPRDPRADRLKTKKTPVFVLVERGGRAQAMALEMASGKDLKAIMRENVEPTARIHTNESPNYKGTAKHFARHETVNLSQDEFARGDVTTNTGESFFSLVKRAHYGTHYWYSKRHMSRYITERQFIWNGRKMTDGKGRDAAIRGAGWKRLTYKEPRSR